MINETAQAVIETTKAEIYNPVIISIWVSVVGFFWLFTWINSMGNKTKWTNFWKIWLPTTIASGIVTTIFIMSPETISDIINWVKDYIKI